MEHIAIVGAGQAGAALASRLRQEEFSGDITVYGSEVAPPYQRPPLSKKYLSGEWDAERLWLRPRDFWDEQRITLKLGNEVSKLDLDSKSLIWQGNHYHWSKLALTTGATPRPHPSGFQGRDNVFELRTLADVERLRKVFRPAQRLLVLGGGYIGLETAAVAAQSGLSVTVVEQAPRILQRVACSATAAAIRSLHERHGVTIYEGHAVSRTNDGATLTSVTLDNGLCLECDLVVVGVGVLADTRLASVSGIQCNAGILVDEFGRTSAADVWAAGDCAEFPFRGALTRLESVQNAIDQAETVANDMLGKARPYEPVPWFWSDQYDAKLQIVGLNRGYDAVVTCNSARGLSNWYFSNNQLIAVDALNDGRAYMVGKKLLEAGRIVRPDDIKPADFDPMALLKEQAASHAT